MSISSFPSMEKNSGKFSRSSEAVLEMGSGSQTVVFLHGLFGTPLHWLSIMQSLADSYHLIALPLPVDRQPNRRKGGVRSIGDLTDHIERMVASFGIDSFVLCGNSLGGLVAIDYSLRRPENVSGLVLAGSAGLYERSLTNGVKPRASREFVRQVISDIFHNTDLITEELVDEWYESVQDRDYARFILRVSRATRDRCVEDELCNLTAPTMIVWGRNDEITPPHVAETFKSQIRGAELRYIDDCGHAPNLERPAEFTSILEDFLPRCFRLEGRDVDFDRNSTFDGGVSAGVFNQVSPHAAAFTNRSPK